MNVVRFIIRTLQETPLVFPGLVVSAIVATLFAGSVGRQTGLRRVPAGLLVFALGAILAITVAPGRGPGPIRPFSCDLDLGDPPALAQLLSLFSEHGLNVLLFVPLGCFVGLIPRTRPFLVVVAGLCLLPFVVEGIQLTFPELHRVCQAWDVAENLLGFAIGIGIGVGLRASHRVLVGRD